ncbi:unnamed protein product [Closterium sp. Naga37s-1]|nr:unnamed protein product [Closterium sp. Naga37s-1]
MGPGDDALHGDSKAGAPAGSAVRENEGGEQQACEGRGLSLEQFEVVLRRVEGQMKTLPRHGTGGGATGAVRGALL